jgi:hypothetical protein
MKRLIKYCAIIITLINSVTLLHARQDCLDNSYHLKRKYDYKNYHYVACTCPCSEYQNFSNRGECQQCRHYHVPKDWMVVSGDKVVMRVQQTKPVHSIEETAVSAETRAVIKMMVAKYKKMRMGA